MQVKPPPDEVWVCFKATRDDLERMLALATDPDQYHPLCPVDAIRAALERKGEAWVGWASMDAPNVWRFEILNRTDRPAGDVMPVLVVPLEELGALS